LPKFFVSRENIGEAEAYIRGDDANHIARVLRTRIGEQIMICDGAGNDYTCEIREISHEEIRLSIVEKLPCNAEPDVKITLFMALPKSDKMEYVIQKAVELGVYEIVPFSSSRCVVKLDSKAGEKKAERWQKIAHSAAKQSGRGIIPKVYAPITFNDLKGKVGEFDLPLFCYECEEENSLKNVLSGKTFTKACIVVGPEGGFDRTEVEQALESGFISVSLGKRILRCETAPGCAICAILYHTDNL